MIESQWFIRDVLHHVRGCFHDLKSLPSDHMTIIGYTKILAIYANEITRIIRDALTSHYVKDYFHDLNSWSPDHMSIIVYTKILAMRMFGEGSNHKDLLETTLHHFVWDDFHDLNSRPSDHMTIVEYTKILAIRMFEEGSNHKGLFIGDALTSHFIRDNFLILNL